MKAWAGWAGAALTGFGIGIGEPGLILLGVTLCGLALVAVVWLRAVDQLSVQIDVRPARLELGGDAELRVTVTNPSPFPIWGVTVEVESSRSLVVSGVSARRSAAVGRHLLPLAYTLRGRERVERAYRLLPTQRGYHTIGPVAINAGDPFAMESRERTHDVTAAVVAYPRRASVRTSPWGPFAYDAGIRRLFSLHEERDRIRGARAYRAGDRPRDIHWRHLARTARLATLDRERSEDRRVTLLVDLQTGAQPWLASDPDLAEYVISFAAGLARTAIEAGGSVAVITNSTERTQGSSLLGPGRGDTHLRRVLTFLALTSATAMRPLRHVCQTESALLRRGDVVVISALAGEGSIPALRLLDRQARRLVVFTTNTTPMGDELRDLVVLPMRPASTGPAA